MRLTGLALTAVVATACSPTRASAPASTAAPANAEGAAGAAAAVVAPAADADATAFAGGSPSNDDLERALAGANPGLEVCRSDGLARNARLSGHVRVKIRVAADGHVDGVDDQGSTLADHTVVTCFEDALRGLQLPRDAHPYEIAKSYTVLPPPDVWPTARDGGPSR